MTIGPRLILPRIAPVCSRADDRYRRSRHTRLSRCRSRNRAAIIAPPQTPQRKIMRAEVIDSGFQIGQIAADQMQLDLVQRARARRRAKQNLAARILFDLGDAG
jgi:hypothetical protein